MAATRKRRKLDVSQELQEVVDFLGVLHRGPPDYGGQLAEFLWDVPLRRKLILDSSVCESDSRDATLRLRGLLCTSRATQHAIALATMERRNLLTVFGSVTDFVISYRLCDIILFGCDSSLDSLRTLYKEKTSEDADRRFAEIILRRHGAW
eukprot:CAMPEP_0169242900 /NCGR_PEP_ID=MMETSP1016-20121227/32802_1 /TAXON_ID=342587 /ORGANISM="Karlodinium micrum, Strain CCMP2283" /LENGTH=150 /DNA_ID=CAMNT_0009323153 /DNA_START=58 /DNA_END=507 /DNA_ORIENTATION=-